MGKTFKTKIFFNKFFNSLFKKGDFIKNFENFCIRLNTKIYAMKILNNLKQYFHLF